MASRSLDFRRGSANIAGTAGYGIGLRAKFPNEAPITIGGFGHRDALESGETHWFANVVADNSNAEYLRLLQSVQSRYDVVICYCWFYKECAEFIAGMVPMSRPHCPQADFD